MLGVPPLDSLLEAVKYPHETTPQQPAWDTVAATSSDAYEAAQRNHQIDANTTTNPTRINGAGKYKPQTIELTSSKSACGKTTILSYISAISVLPKHLGGKESTVVYIDSDGRLSTTRLAQIMQHHLQTLSPSSPTEGDTIAPTIEEALTHIHILRPQSSKVLLKVLSSLPTYLFDRARHNSIHRPLGLIAIDSATAFYWQDRFDRAMARLESSSTERSNTTAADTTAAPAALATTAATATQQIIQQLRTLQDRFGCTVLVSTTSQPAVSSSTKQAQQHNEPPVVHESERAAYTSPWSHYASLTLSLSRVPVQQFAPQMDLDACVRDQDKRLSAVCSGRFVAVVVGSNRDFRGLGIGAGRVEFRITGEGVEFE